jgi:hypothetical protein
MSEQSINGKSNAFLLILLPISFVVIFFVSTWRFWLGLGLLVFGLNFWTQYKWQQWCQQMNPLFYEAVLESQGKITPMELAAKGNFPGNKAKRYLDTKASEFGATIYDSQDTGKVYYFITGSILGNILDSSEPPKELASQRVSKTATALLEPPPKAKKEEKVHTEFFPEQTQEEKVHTESLLEQKQEEKVHTESLLEQKQEEKVHTEFLSEQKQEEKVHTESLIEQTEELPVEQQAHVPLEKQLIFGSLIQSELAKRLSVYSSTVFKRRNDPDFSEWSRNRDPDGIAWTYSRKTKEFFPLEDKG